MIVCAFYTGPKKAWTTTTDTMSSLDWLVAYNLSINVLSYVPQK